ncbi:hypothetical protein FPSE_03940 [Fusarium pseudograminearum CS3096]|uniref:Uncharacterized protein n=1 Tax=Fusarium pseudograminearum (strain CS3096) TaxID=1028729 RepID=K3W1E5_FUSPC|nr:hypothetical protein FPSE_03940 [Fusarium pseudograminearum CS3096]EKJ75760.1 hypothetical protein FPSE_03940 [Fusarium pseudograminearum CS3096]
MCTEQYTHFYCIYCKCCIRKGYEWEICEQALQTESKSMGSCGYTDDGEVARASEYCQQCPPDEKKWNKSRDTDDVDKDDAPCLNICRWFYSNCLVFLLFSSSAKLVLIFLNDTDFGNTHRKIKNTTHPTCATTSPSTTCATSAPTVTISRNTVWNATKREQYGYKQDSDDLQLVAGTPSRTVIELIIPN